MLMAITWGDKNWQINIKCVYYGLNTPKIHMLKP